VKHRTNINRFAEITAEIFFKLLHAENLTQSRQDAKIYFTQAVELSCVVQHVANFPTR
jgi:hypothetical protein